MLIFSCFGTEAKQCDDAVDKYLSRDLGDRVTGVFKVPNKKSESFEIGRTGDVITTNSVGVLSANSQKVVNKYKAEMSKGNGDYLYVIDSKGHVAITKRLPNENISSDEKRFLATHRSLYSQLHSKSGKRPNVVAAGEIRVINGKPIRMNNQAGSFHDNYEVMMLENMAGKTMEEKSYILKFMVDSKKKNMKGEIIPNPYKIELFERKMPGPSHLIWDVYRENMRRSQQRLDVADDVLTKMGLIGSKTKRKVQVSSRDHLGPRKVAETRINCFNNPSCKKEWGVFEKSMKKFEKHFETSEKRVKGLDRAFELMDESGSENDEFVMLMSYFETALSEGPEAVMRTYSKKPDFVKGLSRNLDILIKEMK